MSCVCNGERPLAILGMARPALSNNYYIYIDGVLMQIFNDDPRGEITYIPINYCPLCGKKLKITKDLTA